MNQKATEPKTPRTAKTFPFFQVETALLIPQVDSDWWMYFSSKAACRWLSPIHAHTAALANAPTPQINSSRIPRTRGKKWPHKEDESGWPPEKTKACITLHKVTAFCREQINHGTCANVSGSLGAAVMAVLADCLATSKKTTNLLSCAQ